MLTPTENMALTRPMATGINRRGKVSLIIPKASTNTPIPTPWTARNTINDPMDQEKAQPISPTQ